LRACKATCAYSVRRTLIDSSLFQGNLVPGFPGQVNEGVIEVVKKRQSLFSMFKKDTEDFGGPLRPDY
jgi:hypothetical protein